ncbi:hypothetical protein V6C03_05335 [Methyloligella sp. 2.7D]|uniref:hypothetical protein n=1 Tax=unclassified Methyloligella TaxID=2625955 RepID=UPI00157D0379|nr:hypothetical protein [Methyloligella sp. GL2]QKP75992.1 hypothetical protein HT051_00090 [Methyloligella sp. GL2]
MTETDGPSNAGRTVAEPVRAEARAGRLGAAIRYYREAIWALLFCLTLILSCSLLASLKVAPIWISTTATLVCPLLATVFTMAILRVAGRSE